ncbi:MAG: MlaD family protein [Gemmatimonadota bacterium]
MAKRDAFGVGWGEVRRGALYLAVLAAAATTVFFVDAVRRRFLEGPSLIVTTGEARRLTRGAQVWIAGVPAGRVLSIRFDEPSAVDDQRVVVRAVLHRGPASFMRRDATVRIVPSALLAPVILAIDPGSADAAPFRFGDTLRVGGVLTPDSFVARGAVARAELDTLRTMRERLAARLDAGPGSAAALLRDRSLIDNLSSSLHRLAALAGPSTTTGSLRRILDDDSLRAEARRAASRLGGFLAERRARTGHAEPLTQLLEALEQLDSRLERSRDDLAAGRGTAGRAVNDDEIRIQLEHLRAAIDSAKAELIAEPLRWLRVRPF